jgi:fused-like protein
MAHHYKRMEKIGEGMFGSVYRARRRMTAQIVAMKYIPKKAPAGSHHNRHRHRNAAGGLQDGQLDETSRLRQEIEILKGLKHDNIILLLDAFETEHHFCLVMEYARGELYEILRQDRKLPEPLVCDVARQLVQALHYLHSRRIVHRDMKPQNVLISAKGTVKLCDFGFARSDADRQQQMLMQSIKGTPLYMSPELVCNDRCVRAQSRRHVFARPLGAPWSGRRWDGSARSGWS